MRRFVLGFCTLSVTFAGPSAFQQQPSFRARTDLVQLDVVVVDAAGQPVRGLTKDDFQVFDRGRSQTVATLDEFTHARPAPSMFAPTLRHDVADNATSAADRVVILVLDDLHFQGKTDAVKAMARRVVQELGSQASVGLITTSGAFGVEPTEDRALLLREVDRFFDKFDPEGRRVDPRVASGLIMPSIITSARGDPGDLARFFGDMTQYRKLQDVAKMLGADDSRRKAFIWISGGNPGPVDPSVGSSVVGDYYLGALARLLESLRRSNVATYAIDTGDFGPAVLRKIAAETGGFVIGAEDFDVGLDRLISDLDHYYLLGFYPEEFKERGYHQVTVRVGRPGLTVRHRRGYEPGTPPAPPKNKTPLARLAGGVRPNPGLPLKLQAAALPPISGRDARVLLAIDVQADRAALTEPDGLLRDALKHAVWAVDLDKKKVTRAVTRDARIVLDARNDVAGPGEIVRYQVQSGLLLPAGRYQLRASVTSAKTKTGGSVYLEIEVPDFKSRVALGGLVIGLGSDALVPVAANAMTKGWLPIDPVLARDFSTMNTLRVICDVTGSTRNAVDARIELLDGAGRLVRTVHDQRLPLGQAARLDASVGLHGLNAGAYVLRMTASDGVATAQREVGFSVR